MCRAKSDAESYKKEKAKSHIKEAHRNKSYIHFSSGDLKSHNALNECSINSERPQMTSKATVLKKLSVTLKEKRKNIYGANRLKEFMTPSRLYGGYWS